MSSGTCDGRSARCGVRKPRGRPGSVDHDAAIGLDASRNSSCL
jgi:hypothetical protein